MIIKYLFIFLLLVNILNASPFSSSPINGTTYKIDKVEYIINKNSYIQNKSGTAPISIKRDTPVYIHKVTLENGTILDNFATNNISVTLHQEYLNLRPNIKGVIFNGSKISATNANAIKALNTTNIKDYVTNDDESHERRVMDIKYNGYHLTGDDYIFFHERYGNNTFKVQALNKNGNPIGNILIFPKTRNTTNGWDPGFEIGGPIGPKQHPWMGVIKASQFGVDEIYGLRQWATGADLKFYAIGTENFSSYDFGDAPAKYPHVSHKISSNLYLGTSVPDGESEQQSSADASADGADDSDGVVAFPSLTIGDNSFTVPVKVFNNTGKNAYISAWVDFNRDGIFQFNEALNSNSLAVKSSNSLQTINVSWDNFTDSSTFGINNAKVGKTIVRFRLSTSRVLRCAAEHYANGSDLNYGGNYFISPDGEVEDYEITIKPTKPIEIQNECQLAFPGIINSTKNEVQLNWNAHIGGSNTIYTKKWTKAWGVKCNNEECIKSNTLAEKLSFTVLLGNGLNQVNANSLTIEENKEYRSINMHSNSALTINGNLTVKVNGTFSIDNSSQLNINGNVTLYAQNFNFSTITINIQENGSLTLISDDSVEFGAGCTTDNLAVLAKGRIRINSGTTTKGLFYSEDTIEVVSPSIVIGSITAKQVIVGSSSTVNYNASVVNDFCIGVPIVEEPTISINDASIVEGDENEKNLTFTVTLDKQAGTGVTFRYQIFDGNNSEILKNAIAPNDYTKDNFSTKVILEGQTKTFTINVPIKGDTIVENNETFTILLTEIKNAIIEKDSAIGTIIDDDKKAEGTPFSCSDTLYLSNRSELGTGSNDSGKTWLHSINRRTNPYSFSSIGDGYTSNSGGYNAMGYNIKDNFIYAMYRKELIAIDSKGVAQELGEVEGYPDTQLYTGEFDRDGYYYVIGSGGASDTMYKIDIKLKKVIKTIKLSSAERFWDMAIDASGKYFYAMLLQKGDADSDFNNYKVAKIEIATGKITTIGESQEALPSYIGLVFSDKDGDIFMMSNENGFYKVNIETGKLTLLSETLDLTFYNDGTSCPNANIEEPTIALPVAEYRFDECMWDGSTGEVKDSSGNTLNGTAKNSTEVTRDGLIYNAGYFKKVNKNYVEINPLDDIFGEYSREFTITTWIHPTSLSSDKTNHKTANTIFAKASDRKNDNIEIGINSNGTLHLYLDTKRKDKYADFGETGDITPNNWHFIGVSYKDGEVTVQIDNKTYTNNTTWSGATNLDQALGSPLTIGASLHINNYFDGYIDEVKIFQNRVSARVMNQYREREINQKNWDGTNRTAIVCEDKYFISGKVYRDNNKNNSLEAEELGIPNVLIKLVKDTNKNGIYDKDIDQIETSMESLVNGDYTFNGLLAGRYFVIIDSTDSDIPTRYTLSSNTIINIDIIKDSSNNNFAFVAKEALSIGCLEDALMFQNTPTDISFLNLANGDMVVKAENITSENINGAGFNKKDGYYWGFNHTSVNGTLSRVGKDSEGNFIVDHFTIPNLTINSNTGDIDRNGHLYLKELRDSKNVSVIDLDPSSDTYLTILRNITLDEKIFIVDWAFNPQDDKLYAVTTTYLYKIEPKDGTILSVHDINITGSGGYGASFFDKNGYYYIYKNDSGEIFRIDVDAEHPQAVPFSRGGVVGSNDGAMCTDVDIRFDFGDAPSNYATTLENDGARHRVKTSAGETHYLGDDVTTENNGKPSLEANQDEYDDGVTIAGVSLQNYMITSKESLSKLNIKTYGNGYLNAWIDWNRDGIFSSSEQIAHAINGFSGNIDLELNVADIPDINFNGEPIYARFRYSSQQELNATGTAPDGEVEDYAMKTANYPTMIVQNVEKLEGNSGKNIFIFNITFDRIAEYAGSFSYATQDNTATVADNDYVSKTDTINFNPGDHQFQISIEVNGDTDLESNEKFYLNFYAPNYLNLLNIRAEGVIINDDSPTLNIERINSNKVYNDTEEHKKSFFTQIAGRDFDYSIVSYNGDNAYSIANTTVKVELLDYNSTKSNDVIYGANYIYLNENSNRFDIINSDDLKLDKATRAAGFRLSYLLDENGTIIHGNYANEEEYNNISNSSNNREIIKSFDIFSIRPASYRIKINDLDENNKTVTYVTNDVKSQLNLAAGHNYKLKADAVIDENFTKATDYKTISSEELNVTLTFDKRGTTSCADTNVTNLGKEKSYNFINGSLTGSLSHNNVGKYTLHIEDINWTDIDKDKDNLGCVIGSSSNKPDASGRFGCNIASNEGQGYKDITIAFQPYAFNISNVTLSNGNNNGKDYLYLNNLEESEEMSIKLNAKITAENRMGEQLNNFTKGCMAQDVQLSLNVETIFKGKRGASQTITQSGHRVQRKQLVTINKNRGNIENFDKEIQIESKAFLDSNEGNTTIEVLYNMEKLMNEPINPIRLNYHSLEANATTIKLWRRGEEVHPVQRVGSGMINQSRTLFYARVRSYRGNLQESAKRLRSTPLTVELYCKVNRDRRWCDETMNLQNIGQNNRLTDYGWYTAVDHHSATDGNVTALQPNRNHVVVEPNTIPPFIDGTIRDINIRYEGKLSNKAVSTRVDIITQPWLRYSRRNLTGLPNGTPHFSIKTKSRAAITGVGETKTTSEITKNLEFNGKMDW